MASPGITQRLIGPAPTGALQELVGRPVVETTLDNGHGLRLSCINLGGAVTALQVPDAAGYSVNVVLAHDDLAAYARGDGYLGAIVGRYANRIAGGRFMLDGELVELARNNGAHTLHGGPGGLARCWWDMTPLQPGPDGTVAVDLHHVSEHGANGFPGRLDLTVRYTLAPDHSWRIDYLASTDRATVLNLSHHAYFNLAGSGTVIDHELMLAAAQVAEVDATFIPTRWADVAGTPFDLRRAVRVGQALSIDHPQLRLAGGYDHCWRFEASKGEAPAPDALVLDQAGTSALTLQDISLHLAARLLDPHSGRVMEVLTSEPAIQCYTGQGLPAMAPAHAAFAGLCLETQHPPNAPNWPDAPTTVLRPGQVWRSATLHHFGHVRPQPSSTRA